MADTAKPLGVPGWVPLAQTDYYTAPAAPKSAAAKGISVVNTSNAAVQFDMWIGGTTDDKLVISEPIAALGDLTDDTYRAIGSGEHVYIRAGVNNVLAIRVSGMEFDNA